MTAKELKKLKRSELLEMLLARTEEAERLQAALDEANAKLADRTIMLEEAGSIAEASLRLNGVFEAAEEAARQYLENIERKVLAGETVKPDEPGENEKPEKEEKPKEEKKPTESSKSTKSKSTKPKKSAKPKTTDEPKPDKPSDAEGKE